MLRRAITTDTNPKWVWNQSAEHQKYPYNSWKSNYERMLANIERDRARMMRDTLAYGRDLAKVLSVRTEAKEAAWHRSPARKLLKEDVDSKKHEDMSPMDLWLSREEYQAFDLDCFRKHIYQEVDSRPKRNYRFEKKQAKWNYPELHKGHPRLNNT